MTAYVHCESCGRETAWPVQVCQHCVAEDFCRECGADTLRNDPHQPGCVTGARADHALETA